MTADDRKHSSGKDAYSEIHHGDRVSSSQRDTA